MTLKKQFEKETGKTEKPGYKVAYLEAYAQWLEEKLQTEWWPDIQQCDNCGEMVEMIGKDSPDGFCPKCYC